MPSSERPPRHHRGGLTRRRALLAAAVVVGTTGCGLRLESGPAPTPTPVPPTVDELARERAAGWADRLLALVAAVRRTRPDLAGELAQVAANHRAHAAALRPTPTASTSATVTAAPAPTAVPTLVAAERAAVSAVLADLVTVSPSTARLLASVAAALQVHVDLLGAAPTRPPR